MNRTHTASEAHLNWPADISFQQGVRCANMIWVGGQSDLGIDGKAQKPSSLDVQIKNSVGNLERILKDLDSDLEDLVNLNCFYVNDGTINEIDFLNDVGSCLPIGTRTAITAVPVPYLSRPGILVEIEGVAMRGEDGASMPRRYGEDVCPGFLSAKFASAVRCGQMIFVSAQYPIDSNGEVLGKSDIVAQTRAVAANLAQVLASLGAGFGDVVKTNRWYAGGDGVEDFEAAALEFASNFQEPGPAATGIPVPRHADGDVKIKIGVIAMLGESGEHLPRRHVWPDSLWDWHVHLPYKHGLKCENMIFLGGQVSLDKQGNAINPYELTPQTYQALVHIKTILNELGADYEDVCKLTTVYQSDCGVETLNDNVSICASHFRHPGPVNTSVPLPVLAYEGMSIEIDTYAMVEPDKR